MEYDGVREPMKYSSQSLFWIVVFSALFIIVIFLHSILLPFVIGIAIAYLLDPLNDRLVTLGLSRGVATSLLTLTFFILFASLFLLFTPVIYNQMLSFIEHSPDNINKVIDLTLPLFLKFTELIPLIENPLNNLEIENLLTKDYAKILGSTLLGIFNKSFAFLNLLSLLLITPVVSFYLLRDWDKIIETIYGVLPIKHRKIIKKQLTEIDSVLSGFVRGQTMLSIVLGIFYGSLLSIAGLDFGLIIGLFTGLLSFIPYVGLAVGLFVAIIIGILQSGFDILFLIIIISIFMFGQILESIYLQPKLLGKSVGLHPVWIIFGVLSGGTLFGVVGVFLSVPITATIGVLARFLIISYRNSEAYLDENNTQK